MKFDRTTLDGIQKEEDWVREQIDGVKADYAKLVDRLMACDVGSDCYSGIADALMAEEAQMNKEIQQVQSIAFERLGKFRKALKEGSAK